MSIFINGIGNISPQKSYDGSVLTDGFLSLNNVRNACREPQYANFIDPKQIRRMSRVIKMGVVASILAMRDCGIEKPLAVIVGTAFGCLEDTYSFLSKLVLHKEDMLSPTAFIHSTHNTIASQIALLFQCRGYNSTYVHKRISFESALMDGKLLLEEGTVNQVLVGGIDEIIDAGFTIMDRIGNFKKAEEVMQHDFTDVKTKGTVAGEGSTFFSLTTTASEGCYAQIKAVKTMSFTSVDDVATSAKALLMENGIHVPDLVLAGYNGDNYDDSITDIFIQSLNNKFEVLPYKKYCGEYGTASAFALWMAAIILKEGIIPESLKINKPGNIKIANILIYNHLGNEHHSLILASAC